MQGANITVFLVMALMLSGVAFFITQPLIRRNADDVLEDHYVETPVESLLHKKDSVYAAIKDLEFEFKTNKLSEEDYSELRSKLESEAVELLREIDKAHKQATKPKRESEKPLPSREGHVSYCGECGAAVARDDAKFCPSCGSGIAARA